MMSIRWWLGSLLHNCVAHPLLPFLPCALHDWTLTHWPTREEEL